MPSAPAAVADLVGRFHRNRAAYRAGHYNETQVRREFLDPFFAALGWDVTNKHGYAEAYKDVIHEDAIKIGGATKAPDYCFRIGGARSTTDAILLALYTLPHTSCQQNQPRSTLLALYIMPHTNC